MQVVFIFCVEISISVMIIFLINPCLFLELAILYIIIFVSSFSVKFNPGVSINNDSIVEYNDAG